MTDDQPPRIRAALSRDDYVLRALSKTVGKRHEHYVITRIHHLLSDPELEFVCQQAIRCKGRLYLADYFFPQLNLYLEIDEGQHEHPKHRLTDAQRRMAIAEVAQIEEVRLPVSGRSLAEIEPEIQAFIALLRQRKAEAEAAGRFKPWDYETRFTAVAHLQAGRLAVGPSAVFATHQEALRCFGYRGGMHQSGSWPMPPATQKALGLDLPHMVWFPRLGQGELWDNWLSPDGEQIFERAKAERQGETGTEKRRIVMAHSKDELNRALYRFLGIFAAAPAAGADEMRCFRRVATEIALPV